jgi:hypothetical protein
MGSRGLGLDPSAAETPTPKLMDKHHRRLFDPNDKDGLIDKFKLMFPDYGGPIFIERSE